MITGGRWSLTHVITVTSLKWLLPGDLRRALHARRVWVREQTVLLANICIDLCSFFGYSSGSPELTQGTPLHLTLLIRRDLGRATGLLGCDQLPHGPWLLPLLIDFRGRVKYVALQLITPLRNLLALHHPEGAHWFGVYQQLVLERTLLYRLLYRLEQRLASPHQELIAYTWGLAELFSPVIVEEEHHLLLWHYIFIALKLVFKNEVFNFELLVALGRLYLWRWWLLTKSHAALSSTGISQLGILLLKMELILAKGCREMLLLPWGVCVSVALGISVWPLLF